MFHVRLLSQSLPTQVDSGLRVSVTSGSEASDIRSITSGSDIVSESEVIIINRGQSAVLMISNELVDRRGAFR